MDTPAKPPIKDRLNALLAEYGPVALVTYFAIFALVFACFATALQMGLDVKGAPQSASTWVAAFIATKLTQPLRVLATLVLTPLIGRLLARWRSGRAAH